MSNCPECKQPVAVGVSTCPACGAWVSGAIKRRGRLLQLKPLPEIEAAVAAFPMPASTIGVHVRRGDNLENFGESRDDYFFSMMRGILELRPDTTFFLATDVAAVEERFREKVGGALLSAPKGWAPRHGVEGVREGLIDLLLLARTAGIIGNVQSSFSQTAARIGGRAMFLADEGTAGLRLTEVCAFLARGLPEPRCFRGGADD